MNNLAARIKNNYPLWIILWMAAMAIFSFSWMPGGLDVDSCHYGVVAREILSTNHWLKIYDPIDKGMFYTHFPLCLWLTAIIFKVLGVSTFSAKLLSMAAALGTVAVVFYLGRLLKNDWVGFFGGFSLLITTNIIRTASKCRLDMPLVFFVSLAILFFLLAQRRSRWYYILFGLSTSLAIMAKDIAGLAPLAIVFGYLVIRLKWKEFFHPSFILGLLAAAFPVLFWVWIDQRSLLNTWYTCNFMHLMKYTDCNVRWYYYLWVLATKYFYLLPFALFGIYLVIKQKMREGYILIIWAVIFPLAFSFGRQKLDYLILPMYPASALLAGLSFDRILSEKIKVRFLNTLKYLLLAGSIIMLCLPLQLKSKRFEAAVKMAPVIDQVLKQARNYEFVIYKQDRASLWFYSQEIKDMTEIKDPTALEELLSKKDKVLRFCFISEKDFNSLSVLVRDNLRVIFQYKDKIFLVNAKDSGFVAVLP